MKKLLSFLLLISSFAVTSLSEAKDINIDLATPSTGEKGVPGKLTLTQLMDANIAEDSHKEVPITSSEPNYNIEIEDQTVNVLIRWFPGGNKVIRFYVNASKLTDIKVRYYSKDHQIISAFNKKEMIAKAEVIHSTIYPN